MNHGRAAVAALAAFTACVPHTVTILSSDLRAEREALLAGKTVTIDSYDQGRVELKADDPVESDDGNSSPTTLARVLADCPPNMANCLSGRDVHVFKVRHGRELSGTAEALMVAGAIVGAIGGSIYCTAECHGTAKAIGEVGLVSIGVIAIAAIAAVAGAIPRGD